MPLLGEAAMVLAFDVEAPAIPEHDHWHTHEHLPERLSIPGFLRGTRWVALHGQPRYLVLYEVEQLATLTSGPYLQRLNRPSPWTQAMMPHYRGMRRGFCAVLGSFGLGVGHVARLIRFQPAAEAASSIRRWLLEDLLPRLPGRAGLGGAHLLQGTATPPMTNEQRIRGVDAGVDWALLVTGYSEHAVGDLSADGVDGARLERRGASAVTEAVYRLDYTLTCDELAPR